MPQWGRIRPKRERRENVVSSGENLWKGTGWFLWARWDCCLMFVSGSKSHRATWRAQTPLRGCQMNNTTNKSRLWTYSYCLLPLFFFLQMLYRSEKVGFPSMKPQSYSKWDEMSEKHWVQHFQVETKALLSTHITSRERPFWQTGQICACLSVIPWHNSLTSTETNSPRKLVMKKQHGERGLHTVVTVKSFLKQTSLYKTGQGQKKWK